jgi:hypothetical protein
LRMSVIKQVNHPSPSASLRPYDAAPVRTPNLIYFDRLSV